MMQDPDRSQRVEIYVEAEDAVYVFASEADVQRWDAGEDVAPIKVVTEP